MTWQLVTGGAGFIGSHLVPALLAAGKRVRVLDNLSSGTFDHLRAIAGDIDWILDDVTNEDGLAAAMRDVECVFHLAALASVPRSIADPLATHTMNATGTLNVLHAAVQAGVRRVVFSASSSAYGNQPVERKSETLLPQPLSPYAVSKLAGEEYCQAFFHSYGLETVALRYFNVFGPRQNPFGPYAAVIPRFIDAIRQGQPPVIYGDGLQTRDFTYVENVVSANLLAAVAPLAPGKVFNVGSGDAIDLLMLVSQLSQLAGRDVQPQFEPARVGDVRHSLADISRAREILGYQPVVDLNSGLRKTWESSDADFAAKLTEAQP